MANFAKIDDNNKVLAVVRMNNEDCLDENGNESEAVGQAHLEKHNNWPADKWIQTSRNTYAGKHFFDGTPFRGNFAYVGITWDPVNQLFVEDQPYPSWTLNTTTGAWESPIGSAPELPEDEKKIGTHYAWNEAGQSWDKTTL